MNHLVAAPTAAGIALHSWPNAPLDFEVGPFHEPSPTIHRHAFATSLPSILPLPEGEGRGEGELGSNSSFHPVHRPNARPNLEVEAFHEPEPRNAGFSFNRQSASSG